MLACFVVGEGAALALLPSNRHPSLFLVAVLIAAHTVLARVEFEIRIGASVPTMLALVPMIFLLPLAWVPLCAAIGYALGEWIGDRRLVRGIFAFQWALPVFGIVLVLGAAGEQPLRFGAAPLYVAALAAGLALEIGIHSAVHLYSERRLPAAHLTEWASYVAVDAALAPLGFLAAAASMHARFVFLACLPLALLLRIFARERSARIDNALDLSRAYRGTAFLLGAVIDADDGYTGAHSRGVVDLACGVAEALHFDDEQLRLVEFTALLHDVGKIKVPKEIVNKPGKLTVAEWEIIRRHPDDGAEMLEGVGGVLEHVGEYVRHHHEHFDGKGYPDGLVGESIPLISRIVAVCDAYSAITTDRAYSRARSPQEAIEELRRCAGSQFDPKVVDALCRVVGVDSDRPAISRAA